MGIQINTQPQVFASLSSTTITATNVFNNSGIDIISRTNTLFSTVTGITGSNLSSPSLSSETLTAGSGVFNTSISAQSISAGKFYGDGSSLTNIVGVGAGVTSVNGLSGIVTNVVFSNSATNFSQSLTGTNATFTTSVSSPEVSGTHFGSGANLTSLNADNISSGILNNNRLPAVATFTTSVSSPEISAGKFYGDGSSLTNIAGVGAGVTSVNGLSGIVTNVVTTSGATLTGNLLAPALSSQTLTATTANFTSNILSGGTNLTSIFGAKSTTDSTYTTVNTNSAKWSNSYTILTSKSANWDSNYSSVNTNSANWSNSYTTVQGNSADWTVGKTLTANGGRINGNLILAGNLTVNSITALSGSTFVNTVFTTTSALCVQSTFGVGPALYVGSNSPTGDIASFYDEDANIEVLHIGGSGTFPNVGIKVSNPTQTLTISGTISASSNAWFNDVTANNNLTAKQATFTTSVSSPAVSGTHFGSGANLTLLNADNISSGILNNSRLPAIATFTTSVSSPAVSGTHFGSGANLTGITISSLNGVSGGNIVGTTGLNLSSAPLTATVATFTTSISSPSVNGTNVLSGGTNLTSIFGAKTTVDSTFTTVSGITANRLNTPILSSQSLSTNTLTVSGYPITPVTTVYSVANGATATYTVALSDNNNTITLNLGTSGIVVLSSGVAYPVGFQTNVIQLSTGRITLSGSGITLNNDLGYFKTYGRYSAATIINLGSTWVCYGSLSS